MPYQDEIKGIKLLQDRAVNIGSTHEEIYFDLTNLKRRLLEVEGAADVIQSDEFSVLKSDECSKLSQHIRLTHTDLPLIYTEARSINKEPLGLTDILSVSDFVETEKRVNKYVIDFNRRYELDGWDYAIAGGTGLFAAMLDILCVKAPPKPTVAWNQQVDGIFNCLVQKAFNKVLPPDFSKALSKGFPIGAPDSSTVSDLLQAPQKALNPLNHRLRSLAHDPVLGVIFGVWDMLHGTCTSIVNGEIISIPSTKGRTDEGLFQLIGQMMGHLLSDVNAPSGKGNRGMGLPAPFMGLLRMFDGVPVGDSSLGKQIEWMYINGYDFRQFVVSSIPMLIMEVLLRVFYVVKQTKLYGASFAETLLDTMPGRMNPRFRMMLALAYGTSSAVNAGKIYITQNIMNASYASWMGLAWNGFHSLRWVLMDKHLKLWSEIEAKEIVELENIVLKIEELEERAVSLPI